jgi:hypothetical protein
MTTELTEPVTSESRPPALEAALRVIDRAVAEWCNAPWVAAKARGLVAGYHARWASSRWEIVAGRSTFRLPIINPATGRRSRTFSQAGRCDGVVLRDGRPLLLEVKTTSEEIDQPAAPFWRRALVDGRSALHALALRQLGCPARGTLFDVVRRPAIRPRAIPKGSAATSDARGDGTLAEIRERGTYFGRPLDDDQRQAALEGDGRETDDLFAIRLAADTLQRPAWYFQRRIVYRGRGRLAHDAAELWQTTDEIRRCRRSGWHYRNSDACARYGTPCPFLEICAGRCRPDSEQFRHCERIHPELADRLVAAEEPGVLTPSRIQCFRLCRRKHYYRYELGIVPAEPPDRESLLLGRLIHEAVAAWWREAGTKP